MKSCLVFYPCVFFFRPFSIAITLLGEERAVLCDFRVFVSFALVSLCSSSWCQGLAVTCDCGNPWTFSFYLLSLKQQQNKPKIKKMKTLQSCLHFFTRRQSESYFENNTFQNSGESDAYPYITKLIIPPQTSS